ncbi:RNA recognition motif domain-containing protein [Phthorimaea operculella]|nr:RNA recognition motif domain-containing protein [Phthorimaea operculella]
MASLIDMSLEDIIKKKKRENPRVKGNAPPKGNIKKTPPTTKQPPITDARNKIISKKRNQILDAREKLAELAKHKDARLKLDALRKKRALQAHTQGRKSLPNPQAQGRNFLQTRGKIIRSAPRNEIIFGDPSRQVMSQPLSHGRLQGKPQLNTRKFLESRSIASRALESRSIGSRSLETRSIGNRAALESRSYAHRALESRTIGNRPTSSRSLVSDKRLPRMRPIMRTVENDLEIIDDDDPMEGDIITSKPSMLNRKANLQLRIIAHNHDARGDTRRTASHRLSTPEKDRSPPRPPSILKKRPMAALRSEKPEKSDRPALEYRIIVSNLRNTVTGGDIEELFGDVGGMVESRLVRPGTAEVIYKSVEDAQRAVELYHNRQLDGQPMNCLLVTPRAPATAPPARNGSKPALYSTNSNVEPDISTFHKVLFSNF